MTLNLNDLMIFLESQFIKEQHAQAVSFRRSEDIGLHYWLLGYSDGSKALALPPHLVGTNILSSLLQNTAWHVWQETGCWGTMGGDRWWCCDHRPPYQHQHQPCNSLPSSARTRPIYEVPQHHTLPIKVVFCPIGMFYPSPRFSVSPGRGRGCFCRVFLCDTSGGAASLGSHTARVTTCPLSSLNTDRSLLCLKC